VTLSEIASILRVGGEIRDSSLFQHQDQNSTIWFFRARMLELSKVCFVAEASSKLNFNGIDPGETLVGRTVAFVARIFDQDDQPMGCVLLEPGCEIVESLCIDPDVSSGV
jgi:hypothetical protein